MGNQNAHDTFIKLVMDDLENARDFMKTALPDDLLVNLDLSTLEHKKTSYVNEKLKETFADVVYSCSYKKEEIRISLLFEHKSYPDAYIHFQLLEYILNAFKTKKRKKSNIVPVIPIVYYHGEGKWKKRNLKDYFSVMDDILFKFIPDFDYILMDLSDYTDEDIKNNIFNKLTMKTVALIMKNIRNNEKLEKNLIDYLEVCKLYYTEDKGLKFLESIVRYLFQGSDLPREILTQKMGEISFVGGNLAMNTAAQCEKQGFEKGIEQGKQEGKLEGIEQGKIETAKNMISSGLDIKLVVKVTGLPKEKILELRNIH